MIAITLANSDRRVIIDPADSDLARLPWRLNQRGYAALSGVASGAGTPYILHERMHRLIMARQLGRSLLLGECVDHIDGDRLNNRRQNLRLCSNAENQRNRGRNSNNTTGYKGVYRNPGSKRRPWLAKIGVNGRLQYLGSFTTAGEAARAYDQAARRLHGEFARGNLR
jgi:hypothetical protein